MDIAWNKLIEVLNAFADEVISTARQNLDANNTNASRTLYDSMEKIVEVGEDYYKVSISMADYWNFVESGRGPGKFPPPPAIRNWIEIKPVTPTPGVDGRTPTVEQLTFLIGRKIAQEGTTPQPFLQPAVDAVLAKYEERIASAIDEDVSNYILELVEKKMRDALG